MIELPNSIRRRLEVLTAVGLATVSTPTAATGSGASDGSGSERTDESRSKTAETVSAVRESDSATPDGGGEIRGR